MKAPCKDCPNREIGCHSSCEAYKEYARFCEDLREKRLKERMKRDAIIEHKRNSYRRNNKKHSPF